MRRPFTRLRLLREQRGLNQQDAASRLRTDVWTYNKVECLRRQPSRRLAATMQTLWNERIESLLDIID